MDKILNFIKGLMQPMITVIAVIILFSLASANYDQDKMFALAGGVLLFWFGYTAVKNFNFNGSSKKDESPKVNGGQVVKNTAVAVDNTTVSADIVEEKVIKEPFNETAFDAEIESSVEGVYSVNNPATKFYHAWNRGARRYSWQDPAWGEYLKKLVNRYFSSIWGLKNELDDFLEKDAVLYAAEHLNDDKGCTTCETSLSCKWTSLRQKADYMGRQSYGVALDWMENVGAYLNGRYAEFWGD
jgi:hypothetical protein